MGQWKKPPGRELSGKRYDDEIARVHWSEFERIMGRWYTSQGYAVEDRGTHSGRRSTDGGVDLVLRGHGETVLVQCKHERVLQVPYNAAMQLRGLIHAEDADRAILVTTGEFTPAALRKASKAGLLELIDGEALRRMLGPDIAWLLDGMWVEPAAAPVYRESVVAPAEMARLPAFPQVIDVVNAPETIRLPTEHVASRPMSSKLTAFALIAFVAVLAGVATMVVSRSDTSPSSEPIATAPPAVKPIAATPALQPTKKKPAEPKPDRHSAKAKASTSTPHTEVASAPPQVIYKSADMSDAEFEAWKLRKARREGVSAPAEQASPTGDAIPAQTMQVILRTNRK